MLPAPGPNAQAWAQVIGAFLGAAFASALGAFGATRGARRELRWQTKALKQIVKTTGSIAPPGDPEGSTPEIAIPKDNGKDGLR